MANTCHAWKKDAIVIRHLFLCECLFMWRSSYHVVTSVTRLTLVTTFPRCLCCSSWNSQFCCVEMELEWWHWKLEEGDGWLVRWRWWQRKRATCEAVPRQHQQQQYHHQLLPTQRRAWPICVPQHSHRSGSFLDQTHSVAAFPAYPL
uniref:Uncharacterized protein n=1 Tax=Physcomitrium patens TaxID=3218 RepID=A0A2K1KH17_PHYPA|nr:hypothetical protein PHYPA_009451 [Physcomitrium patens]